VVYFFLAIVAPYRFGLRTSRNKQANQLIERQQITGSHLKVSAWDTPKQTIFSRVTETLKSQKALCVDGANS
jgi:hypothetical protein